MTHMADHDAFYNEEMKNFVGTHWKMRHVRHVSHVRNEFSNENQYQTNMTRLPACTAARRPSRMTEE